MSSVRVGEECVKVRAHSAGLHVAPVLGICFPKRHALGKNAHFAWESAFQSTKTWTDARGPLREWGWAGRQEVGGFVPFRLSFQFQSPITRVMFT